MSRVFNGLNNYLKNTVDGIGITAFPFTVAVWVKFASSNTLDNIWRYTNDVTNAKYFRGEQETYASQAIAVQDVNAFSGNSDAKTIDTWLPYVYTFESANTEVRGIGVGNSSSVSTAIAYATNINEMIGIGGAGDGTRVIDGKIAHFVVWNIALSAANKQAFIDSVNPANVDSANQTAYWDLTDGTADADLTDTVNSIVLTNINTTIDNADNPVVITETTQIGDIQLDFSPTAKMGILM